MSLVTNDVLAGLDWERIEADVEETGSAVIRSLLDPETCAALRASYDREDLLAIEILVQAVVVARPVAQQ